MGSVEMGGDCWKIPKLYNDGGGEAAETGKIVSSLLGRILEWTMKPLFVAVAGQPFVRD